MNETVVKEMIAKELKRYQENKESFKPYMQSMKEIGSWLQTKEKK